MSVTANPVIAAILERRACRAFKPEQVKEEDIHAIIEAGRYAATAHGGQPQHFTVVQDQALLARLVAAAKRAYSTMSDEHSRQNAENSGYHTFYKAPTVILLSSDPAEDFGEVACANAMQNMAVAAQALGLAGCYIGSVRLAFSGPDAPELLKALGVPGGYAVRFAFALGHAAGPKNKPAPRKQVVNWIK